MPPPRLILASASPRRQSLLREAGYSFLVHPADIDEENFPRELAPDDVALHLAQAKAEAMAAKFPNDVILAADTVVALGDRMLGKPADADDARRMLGLLSGTTHRVITGVAVRNRTTNLNESDREISGVQMRALSSEEIERYLATDDWRGKAGSYGIQDNDPFVTRLFGSVTNIVGLPMELTERLLKKAGISPTL